MANVERDPRELEIHSHFKLYLTDKGLYESVFVGWVDTPSPVLNQDGFLRFWTGVETDTQPSHFMEIVGVHVSQILSWRTVAVPIEDPLID